MKQTPLGRTLIREMSVYFPRRWEVSAISVKKAGDRATGTIKIYCATDDKTFLSDFDARLDSKGGIRELAIDGVMVKNKLGCVDADAEGSPSG